MVEEQVFWIIELIAMKLIAILGSHAVPVELVSQLNQNGSLVFNPRDLFIESLGSISRERIMFERQKGVILRPIVYFGKESENERKVTPEGVCFFNDRGNPIQVSVHHLFPICSLVNSQEIIAYLGRRFG